jgi:transposase
MGQASPRYTAEFKKKTVDLYNSKKTTYAAVATDLGIDPGTLSNWVRAACSSEEET